MPVTFTVDEAIAPVVREVIRLHSIPPPVPEAWYAGPDRTQLEKEFLRYVMRRKRFRRALLAFWEAWRTV